MTLFDTVTTDRPCHPGEVAAAEAALGLVFPASYRRFCTTYGPGLIGGLFGVATPMADPHDPIAITMRNPVLDARLRDSLAWYDNEGFTLGVDVFEDIDLAILGRARFFGRSYDGHELFWDVQVGVDEYAIYVVGYDGSTVRHGGATLDELILTSQTPRVKTIFGPGYGRGS